MKTFALVAAKGGVGKTTLAAHLAVEAERAGRQVTLIDLDPQGSLTDWWNERSADSPRLASTTTTGLDAVLDALAKAGVELVIIDTPPGQRAALEAAVKVADIALIPTQPSPLDIRAVAGTVKLVEQTGRPFAFVLNRVIPRTVIAAETTLLLAQHGRIAPEPIRQRVDYAAAMTDGRTAQELASSGPAAREISALWHFISHLATR